VPEAPATTVIAAAGGATDGAAAASDAWWAISSCLAFSWCIFSSSQSQYVGSCKRTIPISLTHSVSGCLVLCVLLLFRGDVHGLKGMSEWCDGKDPGLLTSISFAACWCSMFFFSSAAMCMAYIEDARLADARSLDLERHELTSISLAFFWSSAAFACSFAACICSIS
jgi:hypothetical protein